MSIQVGNYIAFNENREREDLLRNSLGHFNKLGKLDLVKNEGQYKNFKDEVCMTSGFDNISFLLEKNKGIDIVNLRELKNQFGIDFSDKHYKNVINPDAEASKVKYDESKYNLDISLDTLDLKNKNEVVSVITCVLNSAYQSYIKGRNEITAKVEPIILPQHMINEIYIAKDDKKIIEVMDLIIGRYIDKDKVYPDSYQKQIENAYKDIDNISKLRSSSDKQKEHSYGDLLPDYRKDTYPFGFGEIGFGREVSFNEYDELSKRIKIAEEIISMIIPKKYRCSPDIDIQKKMRSMYLVEEDRILMSSNENIRGIVHESIHSGTCYSGCDEIHIAESDYLNEFTRNGVRIIYNFGYGDYICKVVNTNIPKLSHYAMKMCKNYECYTTQNEFLSIAVPNILIGDIELIDGKVVDSKSGKVVSVEEHIKTNFDELCEQNKELAAFILTYLRGDFKM